MGVASCLGEIWEGSLEEGVLELEEGKRGPVNSYKRLSGARHIYCTFRCGWANLCK